MFRQTLKTQLRAFHSSRPAFVSVGDKIPQIPLFFQNPGTQIDLADKAGSGKSLIVGVPGAFTTPCSKQHIPGFLSKLPEFEAKGFKSLYVVAVNDPFVVDNWSQTFNAPDNVQFLADPQAQFVGSLDLKFDASAVFGNERSKRFALAVEDGVVTHAFVEPENTPVDVSDAANVLKGI